MRRKVRRAIYLLFFLLTAQQGDFALPTTPTGLWTFNLLLPYTYWLDGLVPSGGGISVLFDGPRAFHGVDTIFEEDIAAGWQINDFYRKPDGSAYRGSNLAPTTFDQAGLVNDLGIRQGLSWDGQEKRNRVEAFLFYRVHFDKNFATPGNPGPLVLLSNLPDHSGIFANSVLTGIDYNGITYGKSTKSFDGAYAEASIEWGPSFLGNSIGSADFSRFDATLQAYRTIFTLPKHKEVLGLSAYVVNFSCLDLAFGSSVPFFALEGYGGRFPRPGNITSVRGFEPGRFGAEYKLLSQLELRIVSPSLFAKDVTPGMYGFFDAAYDNGPFSDSEDIRDSVLASTGLGFFVNFFDTVNVTIYAVAPVINRPLSNSPIVLGASGHLAF